MGGSYFNTAQRNRRFRPSRANSSDNGFEFMEHQEYEDDGEGTHNRLSRMPRQSSQMTREQRSWGIFCSSTAKRKNLCCPDSEIEQESSFDEKLSRQTKAVACQRKKSGQWQWHNWCSDMYFNCTQVNRQTIISECLEDLGRRSNDGDQQQSPVFAEAESVKNRRHTQTGFFCKCTCRDCKMANQVEAQKFQLTQPQRIHEKRQRLTFGQAPEFDVSRDIYFQRNDEEQNMKPIATEHTDNERILSPTEVEMSLRRSTRIHFNKGITIQKDPNNSSVLRPSISNQRSRCSRAGSMSRKDDTPALTSEQTSRVHNLQTICKNFINNKGHCEQCREEQLLNGPEYGRVNQMDRIDEMKSDLSSPRRVGQNLDSTIQQNSPGNVKSSNSEIAFQVESQRSESKKLEGCGRIIDKSFDQTPRHVNHEELRDSQLDFIFPGSQGDRSSNPRPNFTTRLLFTGGCNTSSSALAATPDMKEKTERRSMQPQAFNQIMKTPVNQRGAALLARIAEREANTQKANDCSFLNQQSIRISDSKSIYSRNQNSAAGPFCDSQSYFEPHFVSQNEVERLSKLHLARRRSSVLGHSPAPSPPDPLRSQLEIGGGNSTVLMQSPMQSSRRKESIEISKDVQGSSIFENDGENVTLRSTGKNKVVTYDIGVKGEKSQTKKKQARPARTKTKSEYSERKSPTPAEQYLQDFIKDSKQKIKKKNVFDKTLSSDSSVNHLLPKKQQASTCRKNKPRKIGLKSSDSQHSISSVRSSQANGQNQLPPNAIHRSSPRDNVLKEFQQKYLQKNTLSVLRELNEETSVMNESPQKTLESQTFLKSVKGTESQMDLSNTKKVMELQSPQSGSTLRAVCQNESSKSKRGYIPRLKTKQISGFSLKLNEDSSNEKNQHSSDDLFQNAAMAAAVDIVAPVPFTRPRQPSKNQSYSDLSNKLNTGRQPLETIVRDKSTSTMKDSREKSTMITNAEKAPSGFHTLGSIEDLKTNQPKCPIGNIIMEKVMSSDDQSQNKPTSNKKPKEQFDYVPSYYNKFPLQPQPMPTTDEIIIKSDKLEVYFGNTNKKVFSSKYVTLQKNGKLVIHTPIDPFNPHTCSHFNELIGSDYLDNLWELGGILQINRDKNCQIVASLDLQYLFPGTKVFLRDKTKELELKVYEFERSDYQDDLAQPFGFSQQWEKIAFIMIIKFEDQDILDAWFAAINDLLSVITKGYFELQNNIKEDEFTKNKIVFQQAIYGSLLTQQTDFYAQCSVRENAFLDQVDTGDVLLFRSNNQIGTWITRTVSRSHFDHVGIALRFGNEVQDLYILESVGEDGVRLTSWLCARGFIGNFFNKVGFRKLNYELEDKALEDFDVFRKKSCGKKYALNFSKLITTKSEAVSQSLQAHISEDRKFFCSELVAKSFKVLGLMKDLTKSSTRYYPGCFEPGGQVDNDMKDGIHLGPVFNILADWSYFLDPEEQLSQTANKH